VLQEQGVRTTAIRFTTPFFGTEVQGRTDKIIEDTKRKYGIDLKIVDITPDYLTMLKNPAHGYGKHFNPCIDCKILMVRKAMHLLEKLDADFIATGEVIGQRPMSQRKDTLNCISNESMAGGLLLRPLCARSLKPTIPEERGWVKRQELPHISGRGRKIQIELARKYGIEDYPNPAGGCVLADPIQGRRLKKYFGMWPEIDGNDCRLALTGRQFLLPGGWWLTAGRDRRENRRITLLRRRGDIFIDSLNAPAPSALLRNPQRKNVRTDIRPPADVLALAASILLYYCRKCRGDIVLLAASENWEEIIHAQRPANKDTIRALSADNPTP